MYKCQVKGLKYSKTIIASLTHRQKRHKAYKNLNLNRMFMSTMRLERKELFVAKTYLKLTYIVI